MSDATPAVRLRAWAETDLDLLHLKNAPEMKAHLGGPETERQLLDRHQRYLDIAPPTGRMFVVVLDDGRRAGTIGYWEREWRGELVYETGWAVLPEFQGRGLATAAAKAIAHPVRTEGRYRRLHAFPAVDHPASNAVCRKAGFTLLGETDFEYPPGNIMRSNDWRLDL